MVKNTIYKTIVNYIEVLKPRANILLTFIGVCTSAVASEGYLSLYLLLIAFTIFLASAGANGLTNFFDCGVDAMMTRTQQRVLPSRRIYPPQKVLPLTIALVITGLILAWFLHPFCFLADLLGTTAAIVWRKRSTCVFPQGMIASCALVLMGWFAVKPWFSGEIVLLCLLIALWLPLHVWSVMIAHREEYIEAGLSIFPVNREIRTAVKVLLVFSPLLYLVSIGLYFMAHFSWLYLAVANLTGITILYASVRLVISSDSWDAWRLYRLTAFPYLGVLFLTMFIDAWLLS